MFKPLKTFNRFAQFNPHLFPPPRCGEGGNTGLNDLNGLNILNPFIPRWDSSKYIARFLRVDTFGTEFNLRRFFLKFERHRVGRLIAPTAIHRLDECLLGDVRQR